MERPRAVPPTMSKRMLGVVIVALLFILVPSVTLSAPTSVINISVTNASEIAIDTLDIDLYVSGSASVKEFRLDPGESWAGSVWVRAGDYSVTVYYVNYWSGYSGGSGPSYQLCTVGWFDEAQVYFSLYP